MANTYLSVIVPAFNEEKRIGASLENMVSFLRRQSYSSEIIVVDDGSSDKTKAVAEKALADFPHRVIAYSKNRGKGHAVKRGMLDATGEYLLFTDADLSTPIEEVKGFLKEFENGYDVVIGSRALKQSKVEIHQPFFREFMGRIFNRLARVLAFRQIYDSQCGFKCFNRKAGRDLFTRQRIDGFGFDVEIVFLAQKLGYRLLEKPVRWMNSKQTRVRIFSDPIKMFGDLFCIRWMHRGT